VIVLLKENGIPVNEELLKKFNFSIEEIEADSKLLKKKIKKRKGNTLVEKNTSMNDKQMCNPSLIDSEIDFSYLGKNFTLKTSPPRKNELWNQSELQNTKSNVNYFPCFKLLLNAEPNVINLIYRKM
jgi:hypothetical protein